MEDDKVWQAIARKRGHEPVHVTIDSEDVALADGDPVDAVYERVDACVAGGGYLAPSVPAVRATARTALRVDGWSVARGNVPRAVWLGVVGKAERLR